MRRIFLLMMVATVVVTRLVGTAGPPLAAPPQADLELIRRLRRVRESFKEVLVQVGGIEDDYRRGLLEAHITGAIREIDREIDAQIQELVSSH
jgi:hypothetical protein